MSSETLNTAGAFRQAKDIKNRILFTILILIIYRLILYKVVRIVMYCMYMCVGVIVGWMEGVGVGVAAGALLSARRCLLASADAPTLARSS